MERQLPDELDVPHSEFLATFTGCTLQLAAVHGSGPGLHDVWRAVGMRCGGWRSSLETRACISPKAAVCMAIVGYEYPLDWLKAKETLISSTGRLYLGMATP